MHCYTSYATAVGILSLHIHAVAFAKIQDHDEVWI